MDVKYGILRTLRIKTQVLVSGYSLYVFIVAALVAVVMGMYYDATH